MSQTKTVAVGHYIWVRNLDAYINMLYAKFEDQFCHYDTNQGNKNLIFQNTVEKIFHIDEYDDHKTKQIKILDISEDYSNFLREMGDILKFLRERGADFEVRFGANSWSS